MVSDTGGSVEARRLVMCTITADSLPLYPPVLLPDYFGFHAPAVHAIFDISFFIIVTIITLNIVFGIIVDSFR